jgi:hypothetical protein
LRVSRKGRNRHYASGCKREARRGLHNHGHRLIKLVVSRET